MRRIGIVVAVLVLALTGCAKANTGGGDSLVRRTFLSTALKNHELLPGTRLWLAFPEQGQISAQAGCNHMFGKLAIDGDKFVVTEIGTTDMGCEQARGEQDQWLSAFLTSKPAFRLQGDQLTLTSGQVEITLLDRSVAEPDRNLVGPKWTVTSLIDGQTASSVPSGVIAVLTFSEDGKVSGSTGCNILTGDAKVNGDKLLFGDLITSKRMCVEPAGPVEGQVLGVLQGEVSWRIEANKLVLTHPGGRGLELQASD